MSSLRLLPSSTLEKTQPIYKIEHDCLTSKNGDITIGFELSLLEIFTQSREDYEALHSAVVKAVRLLPTHTFLHKQDWFVTDKYKPSNKEGLSLLSHSYERHFNERPFLHHTCYLYITKTPAERVNWTSVFSLLGRPNVVPKDMLDEKSVQNFFDCVGQFVRVLQDSKIGVRRLTADELAGVEGVNGEPDKPGLLEKYLSLDMDENAPLVDIDFTNGLKVGNKFCDLYSIARTDDVPAGVDTDVRYKLYSTERSHFAVGTAAPISLLLSCNHIYNQYIFIDDHAATMQALEKKKDRLQSMSAYSRQNSVNRDWYNQYLNEATSEQKLSVRMHCNVLVWSEREEELTDLRNLVTVGFANMNCTARQNTVDIGALYWAGIPGNAGDFPAEETFYTFAEQACCFWNMETNYADSPKSICGIKLSDRITGRPVLVDISDAPMAKGIITNRNKFILGASGSGKSFFTNHMVRQYYEQGTHVVLVDVGHSYKGQCELVGGVYYTYTKEKPISFNPFYMPEGRPDVEQAESLITLLQTLWKKDDEASSRAEYVSLSNAIFMFYDMLELRPDIHPDFNTFYEFCSGPYRKILEKDNVREKEFDISNFLYVLRPYYRGGTYDYLLNSPMALDLVNERFIVFELDNIKDHPILFPVVTLIIMETFISKMRRLEGIRKMILIEEAWKAIATAGMASYIVYLFKTVRKFFGEAIVVTQEVNDIIGNPIVKDTILNQSDCKILLDMSKLMNRFDDIQTLMGLTEKEKALVLSINKKRPEQQNRNFKDVFISLGGVQSKVYATEVSTEEYVTYTTEQKEKMRLFEYHRKNGGYMQQAIKTYAADLQDERAAAS